jgi:hypothetical protein
MLAGIPIHATLFDRDVLISPLTIRGTLNLNIRVRKLYLEENIQLLEDVPDEIKVQILIDLKEKARNLSVDYGDGQLFLFTNANAFCTMFAAYCVNSTPPVTEEWIKEKCCVANQVTMPAVNLLKEIQESTVVSYPKQQDLPKRNEPELAKFFEDADAESLVRMFRSLAERYHFSMEQIFDMTPYQGYCMLAVLPEEARHIWEMENMHRKNISQPGQKAAMPPPPPGTVQMSPEEYNAFMMQRRAQS